MKQPNILGVEYLGIKKPLAGLELLEGVYVKFIG